MPYNPATVLSGYIPTPPDRLLKGVMGYGQESHRRVGVSDQLVVLPRHGDPIDQNGWNSCTGNAMVHCLQRLAGYVPQRSPYAVWTAARNASGFTGNSGAYLDKAADYALDGVPSLLDEPMPYQGSIDRPLRTDTVRLDQLVRHAPIPTSDLLAGCHAALQAGHPVYFGVGMNAASFFKAYDQNGVVTGTQGEANFYHALALVGRDPVTRLWLVQGSYDSWLNQQPLASPHMDNWMVAFTDSALVQCGFEFRELIPVDAPPPAPQPTPTRNFALAAWRWNGQGWDIPPQDLGVVPEDISYLQVTDPATGKTGFTPFDPKEVELT